MTDEEKWDILDKITKGELEQDIVVLEDMHIMPYLNVDYHSQYFYIGMCCKGKALGRYDYRDTDFSAGDICWILPDHVLSHNYVSDDYTVLSVFITKRYFKHLKQQGLLGKYQYLTHVVCMSLSSEIFDIMHTGFTLVGKLAKKGSKKCYELTDKLINIIANVCDEYIKETIPDITQKLKLHEELFERFYDAIIEHYKESREVSFYAQLLCRSPKYFATVIKETTGLEAKEWINRYVIIEAKWMLLHDRQKSIQQIADYLGFTEQSSFCRLFKNIEGITPTEFRNNWN